MKKNLTWYERLASWLECRGRYRLIPRISPDTGLEEKYLERFYILSTKWIGIYLHRFWADDPDPVHDHPWHSISILLKHGYIETEPERQLVPYGPKISYIRRPFHPLIKIRNKHDAHSITLLPNSAGKCWSLFIRFGLKRRTWGFYDATHWEAAKFQSRKNLLEM